MSKSPLAETLQKLTEAKQGRSETSRLRDVFPDVERALAAGVRRQAILDALHEDGFTMNMKAFEKALYRIRKKAALGASQPAILEPTKPISRPSKPDVAADENHLRVKSKPHPFAGLSGNGRDKDAVHHSVPDLDRIYGRKKPAAD